MGSITITKTNGNLGRQQPSEDAISALCMNGVAVSGNAALNTVYELNNVSDAEALGLTEAYDLANKVLVWHRIRNFFLRSPNGKLFIMLVSQATTLTQMADKTTANGLAKLLRDPKCAGLVRQAAIARNPASGYTPTSGASGLDGDVLTVTAGPPDTYSGAIIKAQALAEEEETLHRPVMIFVEGRGFNGTTAAAADLHLLNCPQVAVTIAQDYDVAALDALFNGYAGVEDALGMAARRAVNESIGWVADGNLQDMAAGIYVTPALSSHQLLSAYTDVPNGDFDTLEEKAYIFPKLYTQVAGVYFNSHNTCVALTNDYSNIQNNRTIQKAIRIAYKTLVPDINRTIPVDATTGKMTAAICKYFEEKVNISTSDMVKAVECSAVDCFVNPNQNVISTSKVTVKVSVTPTGTAEAIDAYIGFVNPFNS